MHRRALLCLPVALAAACAPPAAPTPAPAPGVTLHVAVPAATPADSGVYVAGSFNGWNPGDPAFRMWRSGAEYVLALPPAVQGTIEFKFTLGSWERVELTATGDGVENRRFVIPAGAASRYEGAVRAWRDPRTVAPPRHTATASVRVLADSFAIPQLGRTRRVWIYLPPDYATSQKRYPVLYMHDGQNVFDAATGYSGEWGVDETLDSLQAGGDHGVIVVGEDHGAARRFDEYSPWRNERYGGGEGDAYVDFLATTLKPYIDQHFRTRPERASTAVAGSSMGGLISLYAALKYPEVFGRAGVFSPALWVAPAMYRYARTRPPLPDTRIFFVTGAQEGNEPEVYVNDQRRMIDTLTAAGWRVGVQMDSVIRADGTHSEWFWRREFPAVYRWLFAPQGAAAAPRQPGER